MSTSSEFPVVLTSFTLMVSTDGAVDVYLGDVPAHAKVRNATLDDLEMYASHLVQTAGRALLIQSLTPPPEESTADKVSGALAKRANAGQQD